MAKKLESSSANTIKERLAQLNSKYGNGRVVACFGNELPPTEYVPTGNIQVDTQLFGGLGLPQGTSAVLEGWKGSGKTVFLQHWIAAAQKQYPDKYTVIVAGEKGDYCLEAFRERDIDQDRIIVLDALTAESSLRMLVDLLWDPTALKPRDEVSLWGIDSIAALLPEAEEAVEIGDQTVRAPMATLLHKFLRPALAKQGKAVGIMVNQLRRGMSTGMPSAPKQFGGEAPEYYPKVLLKFTPFDADEPGKVWNEKQRESFEISVKAEKNNTHTGFQGAQCYYHVYNIVKDGHGRGIDPIESLIRAAVIFGQIKKSASWLAFDYQGEEIKAQGESKLAVILREKPALVKSLKEDVFKEARRVSQAGVEIVDKETGELLSQIEEHPSVGFEDLV